MKRLILSLSFSLRIQHNSTPFYSFDQSSFAFQIKELLYFPRPLSRRRFFLEEVKAVYLSAESSPLL